MLIAINNVANYLLIVNIEMGNFSNYFADIQCRAKIYKSDYLASCNKG